MTMKRTLGAPSLARSGDGQAGSDSPIVRPMRPGKVVPGLYSLSAMHPSPYGFKLTLFCVIFASRASGREGAWPPSSLENELPLRTTSPLHERRVQREVGESEAVFRCLRLMPVGVDERRLACLVETRALIVRELHVDRGEIVAELRLRAAADDQRRHSRPAEQPGERDLRPRDAVRFADRNQYIDNAPQCVLVADRRLPPPRPDTRALHRLVAAMLAGQKAAGDRAPHEDSELLIEGDGNEFVFGLARLERVMKRLRHEWDAAVAARDLHRLHHVPAGPVRTADVAHLARAHETVERLHRLLERSQAVPLMHLIEIDDIGAQTLEARLACANEMPSGKAAIVRPLPHRKARLGRDQHAGLALMPHRFADQVFRAAAGIDVGGVNEIDPSVGDDVDQLAHLVELEIADFGEVSLAAKRHRAHRQHRDFQTRIAKLPVFHRALAVRLSNFSGEGLTCELKRAKDAGNPDNALVSTVVSTPPPC